jgi:hypothetical protein
MPCAAIFECNECGRERASGEFKGHRSGMRDSAILCFACDTKQPHTFKKFIWEDTNPDEWERLVLVPAKRSDVPWDNPTNQGKETNMINLQRNNNPTGTSTPKGVQFLRPMHVTPEGVKAKIVKATDGKPDNFGNPVVVDFTIGGQKYGRDLSTAPTTSPRSWVSWELMNQSGEASRSRLASLWMMTAASV